MEFEEEEEEETMVVMERKKKKKTKNKNHELTHLLVSNLLSSSSSTSTSSSNEANEWKLVEAGMCSGHLHSLHSLSLLSSSLIPSRHSRPQSFFLFLELLSRFALSFPPLHPSFIPRIVKDIDAALGLSEAYPEVEVKDIGQAMVLFLFTMVVGLIDSAFHDWGLLLENPSLEFPLAGLFRGQQAVDMDVDVIVKDASINAERNERVELLRRSNSFKTIEVLVKLTQNRKALLLLRLVQLNMPEKFDGLIQRLRFSEAHELTSTYSKSARQLLAKLLDNIQKINAFEGHLNKRQLIWMLIDIGPSWSSSSCNFESARSACWVPFDIYMENAMDGKQLPARSAITILTESIKTLQIYNQASWQETFLALWLSALRLVQRERDPLEGPMPHLESRLCILLTIVPLAIANVLEEETRSGSSVLGVTMSGPAEARHENELNRKGHFSRKNGLIFSLQLLGQFSQLICPPASVITEANIAAAKAANVIYNRQSGKDGLASGNYIDTSTTSGGTMRHLIVEACIARKLIDTSAYFWPGYVSTSVAQLYDSIPPQKSPWSTFMEGTPLNNNLISLLMKSPASSVGEIEKLYGIALHGSDEEKPAAAKILCSASLKRGWNIQEHVVHYVVKLLSPPVPPTHDGQKSHLVDYMAMLCAILFGASSIDTAHMLSLHGVIPGVAASLMPLCEVFGSMTPASSNNPSTNDEPSFYMVFSSAFLFLLRLWKFYRPPLEQFLMGGGSLGGELTLEYLLLLRNSCITGLDSTADDEMGIDAVRAENASGEPIYLDFYPKLRAWYCQNKSYIASPLSGLPTSNPVHQVANKILSMIYWKTQKSGGSPVNSSTTSSSGSAQSGGEVIQQRPTLPAWEVLEAIPLVLEAMLTACAHGRLSSRDLTTGLRDLIDFLPASLGGILSYFSAEVTRGIWKPVAMNGTDWPSPAPTLPSIELEMKEILATAGVDLPSSSSGMSPVMLPLPMAALVSLTITFKLNQGLDYIHAIVGPALENIASGCSWPIIPIIGSLWAQKVRRWHHFIVVSCTRSVFRQNKEAVAQLLRSCFSSFLGSVNSSLTNQSSVQGLLGSIISVPNVCPTLAPGFLYLRSCRSIQDVRYVNDLLVGLVTKYARELAAKWANADTFRLKSGEASLSMAAAKAREVAALGASLLCVSGGINLVQELYQETIPTWLLTSGEAKVGNMSAVSHIVEGYTMAYMLIMSGSLIWGVGDKISHWGMSRRSKVVGAHMDFLGRVLEGNIMFACHPATWKAYVSCLVGLLVSFAPAWVRQMKLQTLRKLASGLRGWHECELALSLLERGGIEAMGSVAQLLNVSH